MIIAYEFTPSAMLDACFFTILGPEEQCGCGNEKYSGVGRLSGCVRFAASHDRTAACHNPEVCWGFLPSDKNRLITFKLRHFRKTITVGNNWN